MRFRNLSLFALVIFLWGLNWSVMKMALIFVSPTTFVLHRFVFASVMLIPFALLFRKRIPTDGYTLGKLLIYSLIYLSQILSTQIGLLHESSGISSVLTFTQPLFVFCLAAVFLKEAISALKTLGTIMGFLGVVAILSFDGVSSFSLGLSMSARFLLVLSGFLWAITIVYYKKFLGHVDPLVATFFPLIAGVFPLVLLGSFTNSFIFPMENDYLGLALFSSVGSLVLGTSLWLFLLKREEAMILSGSSFLIPVVAMIFGSQLLGESFYVTSLLGSILVLGGVSLVNLKRNR